MVLYGDGKAIGVFEMIVRIGENKMMMRVISAGGNESYR